MAPLEKKSLLLILILKVWFSCIYIIVLDNFKQFYGETKAVREFVKIKGIKILSFCLGGNKIFYLRKWKKFA